MKNLLRLYPPSWRERYGREMEALLEQVPAQFEVGLDLLLGAAAAYAEVIRSNRILSSAGSFVHGVAIAVLVQAIGFVSLILVAQSTVTTTDVSVGQVHLATVMRPQTLAPLEDSALVIRRWLDNEWLIALTILILLILVLALVVAIPRLVRAMTAVRPAA